MKTTNERSTFEKVKKLEYPESHNCQIINDNIVLDD